MRGGPEKNIIVDRSGGFTYAGVLFLIVLLGMALATAGTLWSTTSRREREAQLLWTGEQYVSAIESYYRGGPAGVRQYPKSLEDLLADHRGRVFRRHLRKLYPDPVTGRADWQLERLADGSIIGLRSASLERPLKQVGFGSHQAMFENAECYCDWVFAYSPRNTRARRPAPP